MNETVDFILGMDWSKVPQELREKTLAMRKQLLRRNKAQSQRDAWNKEFDLAEKEFRAASASQADALNRWNPETNEMKALEDVPAIPTA